MSFIALFSLKFCILAVSLWPPLLWNIFGSVYFWHQNVWIIEYIPSLWNRITLILFCLFGSSLWYTFQLECSLSELQSSQVIPCKSWYPKYMSLIGKSNLSHSETYLIAPLYNYYIPLQLNSNIIFFKQDKYPIPYKYFFLSLTYVDDFCLIQTLPWYFKNADFLICVW
jgi:hypothetical protein